MPQNNSRSAHEPFVDQRLEPIETVQINWGDFKHALQNDYLTDTDRLRGGHTDLRLTPPFKAAMEAETYFSQLSNRYPPEMSPKPLHIRSHLIIETTGCDNGLNELNEWPTRTNARSAFEEEVIEDCGGVNAVVEELRDIFWTDLRNRLPEDFDLGQCAGPEHKRVAIEWIFDEAEYKNKNDGLR